MLRRSPFGKVSTRLAPDRLSKLLRLELREAKFSTLLDVVRPSAVASSTRKSSNVW